MVLLGFFESGSITAEPLAINDQFSTEVSLTELCTYTNKKQFTNEKQDIKILLHK